MTLKRQRGESPERGSALQTAEARTILVVEDEGSLRRVLCRVLEGEGFHVLCSGTAVEAIQLANRQEGRIDLLLTDFRLPGASGYQLTGALLRLVPGLQVIIMSGNAESGIPEPPPSGRRLPHLEKPFSLDDLLELIRELLEPPLTVSA